MKLTAERRRDLIFEFIVPLAPAAVDVVCTAIASSSAKLLLPSARGVAMSDSTLSKIYRSAAFTVIHVPHGWQATFSTMLNELAAIDNRVEDRDVVDLMVAHVPATVESAYNRYA